MGLHGESVVEKTAEDALSHLIFPSPSTSTSQVSQLLHNHACSTRPKPVTSPDLSGTVQNLSRSRSTFYIRVARAAVGDDHVENFGKSSREDNNMKIVRTIRGRGIGRTMRVIRRSSVLRTLQQDCGSTIG